jgi:DNA mismatch repair protein MutS
VLKLLEKGNAKSPDAAALLEELPLFAAAVPALAVPGEGLGGGQPGAPSPVEEAVAALSPDDLTPKEALEALYRLKELERRSQ